MSDRPSYPLSVPRVGAPWQCAEVSGELERAEREFLHTNGAGAYSMSTLALMHTRRHHGLLVAALSPPSNRHVILSHAETSVRVGRRVYRLSTHRFPGLAPTPGYRHLVRFIQDPLPRWIYAIGRNELERRLCLERGRNTLVLEYTWRGKRRVGLQLRPLMSLRKTAELIREHGGMAQRVSMRRGRVTIQPVFDLPPVSFRHPGMFLGSPDWWRRFEYAEDRKHGETELEEDLWTPGVFELELEPNRPVHLVVAVGEDSERQPELILEHAEQALRASDPGPDRSDLERQLWVAADQFCADECDHPGAVAGYPWYGRRGRDLLMSVPGLYLVRDRVDAGKRALAEVLRLRRDGRLPQRMPEGQRGLDYAPADVSPWLGPAAQSLVDALGPDDEFVREQLFPALKDVCDGLVRGSSSSGAWLTPDGLLACYDPERPLTWMDSVVDDRIVTPRRGMPVELQALWSATCAITARLARSYGDAELAELCDTRRDACGRSFRLRFWCQETHYPYDCLRPADEGGGARADASVRPNALIAVAVDPELFEPWQQAAVVERVEQDLLTPTGVRTLEPSDASYRGHFEGDPSMLASAAHLGLAWPHLLGFYARAALRLSSQPEDVRRRVETVVSGALESGPVLGQVPQMTGGDPPFPPAGCPAQASSVALLLEALVAFDRPPAADDEAP